MHKSLLALALMLPLSCFAAKAASTASSAAANVESPFTAERNRAAGNLSTSIVVMQKLSKSCTNDKTKTIISGTVKDWQQRNKTFLAMHYGYVTALIESAKEGAGAEEAKKITAAMVKATNEQSNTIIDDMVKKDGNAKTCEKYFTYVAGGEMDIKPGYPDYKTLNGMVTFMNSQKVK